MTPSSAATSTTGTTAETTVGRATDPRYAGFGACPEPRPFSLPWLCATLNVPVDRADASAGTISLAVYALEHTNQSATAQEPLFTTPGGPGYPGFANYGLWALQKQMGEHHDIVTIDPRGTGHSGAIDCADLQNDTTPFASMSATQSAQLPIIVGACGATLGAASDRYGAVDRAADVEDVRKMLGYDTIDYYGGSFGSVDVQAYTGRYAAHLHAVVLDSGFEVTAGDADYGAFFGVGIPRANLNVVALACSRDITCHKADPDPATTLADLVGLVRDHPINGPKGPVSVPSSAPDDFPGVNEATLASLISGADPVELVAAADAARDGNPAPLLGMVQAPPGPSESLADDSIGDNMAGNCTDYDTPWDRSDPEDVRLRKLMAAEDALPDDAFEPFSKQAWFANNPPDICIAWPAPKRYEAVAPSGAHSAVPALVLSGDMDRVIPTFVSKELLHTFTNATVLTVAGAGHQTLAFGNCAATIAARFFETLTTGDASCVEDPQASR